MNSHNLGWFVIAVVMTLFTGFPVKAESPATGIPPLGRGSFETPPALQSGQYTLKFRAISSEPNRIFGAPGQTPENFNFPAPGEERVFAATVAGRADSADITWDGTLSRVSLQDGQFALYEETRMRGTLLQKLVMRGRVTGTSQVEGSYERTTLPTVGWGHTHVEKGTFTLAPARLTGTAPVAPLKNLAPAPLPLPGAPVR